MDSPLREVIVEGISEKRYTQGDAVNMAGSVVNDTLVNSEPKVETDSWRVVNMQKALSCEEEVVLVEEEEEKRGVGMLDNVHSDMGHMMHNSYTMPGVAECSRWHRREFVVVLGKRCLDSGAWQAGDRRDTLGHIENKDRPCMW